MPRAYPEEFRQRAVELARLRTKPVSRIAAELGIASSALHRWLRHDPLLVAYTVGGLAVALVGVRLLAVHRRRLLALPAAALPAASEPDGVAVTTS